MWVLPPYALYTPLIPEMKTSPRTFKEMPGCCHEEPVDQPGLLFFGGAFKRVVIVFQSDHSTKVHSLAGNGDIRSIRIEGSSSSSGQGPSIFLLKQLPELFLKGFGAVQEQLLPLLEVLPQRLEPLDFQREVVRSEFLR